jgi:hypothetical protein
LQSNAFSNERFYCGFVTICCDPVHFFAILEQNDNRANRYIIGLLELRLGIKVDPHEVHFIILRLLPKFVERQDLAPADRSPRCIDVDDDRFFAGELFIEVRLIINVEFDLLCHGG